MNNRNIFSIEIYFFLILVLASCEKSETLKICHKAIPQRVSVIKNIDSDEKVLSVDSLFYNGERLDSIRNYTWSYPDNLSYNKTIKYKYLGDTVLEGKNVYIIREEKLFETYNEDDKKVFYYTDNKLVKIDFFDLKNNFWVATASMEYIYSDNLDSIITTGININEVPYYYETIYNYSGDKLEKVTWNNYHKGKEENLIDIYEWIYEYNDFQISKVTQRTKYDNSWTNLKDYNFEYNQNCNLSGQWIDQHSGYYKKYIYLYENGKGNYRLLNWNYFDYELKFPDCE